MRDRASPPPRWHPPRLTAALVCALAALATLVTATSATTADAQSAVVEPHVATPLLFSSNTSLTPSSPPHATTVLTPRRSSERGVGRHSWLHSRFTFSFASFYDPRFVQFSQLRVINEDRVIGGRGFGRHPHEDSEIFSYVLSGALQHEDSLGNAEVLRRGDVQFTSAGVGMEHSEFNAHPLELVHFLQVRPHRLIRCCSLRRFMSGSATHPRYHRLRSLCVSTKVWVLPHTEGLRPQYHTRQWSDEDKRGKLVLILSPDGSNGSIPINSRIRVYASILSKGQSVQLQLPAGHRCYIHVAMDATGFDTEKRESSVEVNGGEVTLLDGDGCFVELADERVAGQLTLTGRSASEKAAEMLVFDIDPS